MRHGINFWKIESAGNDFVLIDARDELVMEKMPEIARVISHRHFGIGADGVIFIRNFPGYDFEMLYYNADGSGPVMCGNGGRAALLFVHDKGISVRDFYRFHSADGDHSGWIHDGGIKLTICKPAEPKAVEIGGKSVYLVDTGVPHLILFEKNVENINLSSVATPLRKQFNANVDCLEKLADGLWRIRTFERGVEGETLACGTGSTAAAFVISTIFGTLFPIHLRTNGGELVIEEIDGELLLSGPTNKVFDGHIDINW